MALPYTGTEKLSSFEYHTYTGLADSYGLTPGKAYRCHITPLRNGVQLTLMDTTYIVVIEYDTEAEMEAEWHRLL